MFDYSTQEVINTIRGLYPFSEEFLICENFNEPLTGRKFRFSNVDLAYLFFELEKRFGITFKNTTISEYSFSTIDKISKVIEQIEEETS
jgi:hypothetical protein